MAENVTVYPFGTDGHLPSSIGIINDLSTGGADKALSAEMGKFIKMLVDSYEDRLDALEESGASLITMSGRSLVISRMSDPLVLAGDLTRSTFDAVAGGTSVAGTFIVSGRNLTSAIGLSLSDSVNWRLSQTTLVPDSGKVPTTLITVTYAPASGSAGGTTHSGTISVSYNGSVVKTLAVAGTVASSTSIALSPSALTIKATEGSTNSGTIHVDGLALEADVTLALTGTGLSFEDGSSVTTKTIARATAEDGVDVTIFYTAGASSVTGSVTASSTGATSATATINGVVAIPLEVGSYFDVPIAGGGGMRFTVTSGTDVSVSGVVLNGTNPTSTLDAPLVIPANVNDADAVAVYDSNGNVISATNLVYRVWKVSSFEKEKGYKLKSIIISEGITTLGSSAFSMGGDYSSTENILRISLPSTLTEIEGSTGNVWTFSNNKNLAEIEIKSPINIGSYSFTNCTGLRKIIVNGGIMYNNAFASCTQFSATSGDKPIVINRATTAPNYGQFAGAKPFPTNSNNKVWGKLYCPDVAGYTAKGWNFDEVLDINDYQE